MLLLSHSRWASSAPQQVVVHLCAGAAIRKERDRKGSTRTGGGGGGGGRGLGRGRETFKETRNREADQLKMRVTFLISIGVP